VRTWRYRVSGCGSMPRCGINVGLRRPLSSPSVSELGFTGEITINSCVYISREIALGRSGWSTDQHMDGSMHSTHGSCADTALIGGGR